MLSPARPVMKSNVFPSNGSPRGEGILWRSYFHLLGSWRNKNTRRRRQRISVSIVQQRKPVCTLRREALDGHKKCFENKGALKTNTSSSTDFYSVTAQHSTGFLGRGTAQHGLQISELSRKNTSVIAFWHNRVHDICWTVDCQLLLT